MSHEENSYRNFPALAAYIDRIGARELSFKTFMVQVFIDHYYFDKCFIRIDTDKRTISCTHAGFAPTEAEEAAILAELEGRTFPQPIGADHINGLIRHIEKGGKRVEKEDLFELWDRETGKIVMVQRRYQEPGKNKQYHPWTLFDDGEWRQLEPGCPLPFWKPRQKISNRIMIHEGAKPARFCEWLCRSNEIEAHDARKLHPWAEELDRFEHWGIIGGALAPHRANFAELRRERPSECVYVADNDDAGRRVLGTFSRLYEGQLKWVKFDSRWPVAWDMADPLPEEFFTIPADPVGAKFKGPSLKSLYRPATYATEKIPNPEGKGRDTTILRSTFAEEWFHTTQPEIFVHRDHPDFLLDAGTFNSEVAPFSQVDDTARLLRKDAANKMRNIYYSPAAPSGLSGTVGKGQFINTYAPSHITPEKGDPAPFLDYLDRLIPLESDRHEVKRWVATLIARPEIKMTYGLLLVSETQGVGKTTLGEKILFPIIGDHNVSSPTEKDIVDSQFNGWLVHKRLVLINEIYAGNSSKAYNNLKSIITDKYVTVNRKHQATYELENWAHILACSNSMRALKIAMEDRRWLIPEVTEDVQPYAYWVKLRDWLDNGGLSIVMWWAQDWLKNNPAVLAGEVAPDTKAKQDMIEEGYSKGMIVASWLLTEFQRACLDSEEMLITTDYAIVDQIRNRVYDGKDNQFLEKPATIRKLAKKCGLYVAPKKGMAFSRAGEQPYVIACRSTLATMPQQELKDLGGKLFDFSMIREKL